MKKMRGLMAAFFFLFGMALLTVPHLIALLLTHLLFLMRPQQMRKRFSRFMIGWGVRYLKMVQRMLQLEISLHLPPRNSASHTFVIIANHTSILDHVIVALVAIRLGITDIRWVLKDGMRYAPVVGWLMAKIESAFVKRSQDPADLERIRRCAKFARKDGASVIIYPEGTRNDGTHRSSFAHLLEPKHRGFQVFCEELSGYRVLSLIIDWGDMQGGKTLWNGEAFIGHKVSVYGRIKTLPHSNLARLFLAEEWELNDTLLAQTRAQPSKIARPTLSFGPASGS